MEDDSFVVQDDVPSSSKRGRIKNATIPPPPPEAASVDDNLEPAVSTRIAKRGRKPKKKAALVVSEPEQATSISALRKRKQPIPISDSESHEESWFLRPFLRWRSSSMRFEA